MRILEVTHYMPPHPGGIERVAASLVDGLRARGHEVHWLASATPEAPISGADVSRVEAWNLLEERLGVPYPIWSPAGLRRLRDRISWADVVHVHDCLYMGSVAAALACRREGKPLLLTQHVGYVPFGPVLDLVQRQAYRAIGLRSLRAANQLVACSQHVVDYFSTLGCRRPFQVIPNGIDVHRFAPPSTEVRAAARARFGIPAAASVVLFVGRLVPKKQPAIVAEVQRHLAADGVRLLAVGDGPLAEVFDDVPGILRVPDLAPGEMPLAYAAADVFLLPSRGEGLPVTVQEALLCGLPLVVSDDPAYTSNLVSVPGVAMVAADAAGLAEACRHWLREPPDRESLTRWPRDRWDSSRFLSSYEMLMRGLCQGSEGDGPDQDVRRRPPQPR
jgi:glycosyltransferase involved in cell wall biosynthesis